MEINPNRDILQEVIITYLISLAFVDSNNSIDFLKGGAPRAIFCIGYAYAFIHLNRPTGRL